MEITIDKSIRILVDRYIDTYVVCGGANYNPRITITREDYKAFKVAINTMRKYQKITEIVKHYRENVRDKVTNENMEKILEVVEDGEV